MTTNAFGRPTIYTAELAQDICDRISCGQTLTSIAKLDGYPALTTVFRWLAEKDDFRDKYTRARQDQADYSADYLVDIGQEIIAGNLAADAARVVVDIHKWTAARRAPKKYGERLDLNQTGTFKTVTDKPLTRDEEQARWLAEFGSKAPE